MSSNADKVTQVTTALRKVKGNIERIFEKTPTDMIRGIRGSKGNEDKYIHQCLEEIRAELKSEHVSVKVNAISKLNYLQMLGYSIGWAAFNVIEVFSTPKFNNKRIGYLVASQVFNENTEVLTLTTNQVRKDMHSASTYDSAVAMNSLACFVTADLAHDLVNDVVILLNSSKPYIRKRAVLLLYKLYLKYPEALPATFNRLSERLEDEDSGVQSAAVYVVCELSRKDPKSYLPLAPIFFKLMTASSNNWMLIKIIKLFGCLTPLEPRLGKKLIEPLTNLINNTSAMSLLYECINTVLAVLISISSEAPDDHISSIQLCVQKLSVLVEDTDQNLKYLGLLALGKILKTHPKAVQAMKDVILNCLDDRDESIRLRALDLIHGMVSKKNLTDIVKRLLYHVQNDSSATYRDNLVSKIVQLCSFSNYKYITNFEWYISVLVELTKAEGTKNGLLISQQMLDVAVRVVPVRHFAVSQMAFLVDNANVLLAGSWQYRSDISSVLYAAAWICGEYSEHLLDPQSTLEAMLRTKMNNMPGVIQAVYVQNIGKIYCHLMDALEKEADWDRLYSLDNLLVSKLPQFLNTQFIETQERTATLMQIVCLVEEEHKKNVCVGADLKALYTGDLNPVAPKAQRKMPIPEGLNLNENIYTPPSTDDSEPEELDVDLQASLTLHAQEAPKEIVMDQLQLEKSKLERRTEIENNPHYLKSDKGHVAKVKTPEGWMKSPEPVDIQLHSPLTIVSLEEFERRAKEQLGEKKSKKRSKKLRNKVKQSLSEPEDELNIEIYQGDGEMPENAKSTDDEDHKYVAICGSAELESVEKEDKKKKKKKTKKKLKPSEGQKETTEKSAMNDFDAWLCGDDKKSKEKKEKRKRTKKAKADGADSILESLIDLNLHASSNCLPKETSRMTLLVEDHRLAAYSDNFSEWTHDDKHSMDVTLLLVNKEDVLLTGVEIAVVDSVSLKLTHSFNPFTLEPKASREQRLQFLLFDISGAQKLRAVLTYFCDGKASNLDFHLHFPLSTLLRRSSISSLRFGELAETGCQTEPTLLTAAQSQVSLETIVRAACEKLSMSVVEVVDNNCALLFAITLKQEPICVVLKNEPIGVSVQCRSCNYSLAEAVATELVEMFKAF